MKVVVVAIIVAALSELRILKSFAREYSETTCVALGIAAITGSILAGVFAPNRRFAFYAATALAAPGISYSMLGHGFLEMGGFIHAASVGSLGVLAHTLAHRRSSRTGFDNAPRTKTVQK
jgi:hypothetical protein